jgi:hypothetical protein
VKKFLSVLLMATMLFSIVGCTAKANESSEPVEVKEAATAEEAEEMSFKIGIVTPTLSTSEDEYRGAENMVAKYPGIVKHITLPENFSTEIETGLSQITSLADDPDMKAIIVVSGQSGLLPAFQKIEEKRPDIITMTAPIWDDPELMSKYIDVCIDTDWVRRGETIAKKANDMGAKTIIHYSFPTHMAKEVIVARKDMMKATAESLGMTFVEVSTPDPQTGNGPAAMQQFLREDIPRQIEKYGVDTNIFGTNCPMYDVILDEALKSKFIVAEQCCPTPTQAYPTVMNLAIDEEDAGDFDKINQMISEKAAEADMTGRLSGWPVPVTVYVPEYAVELAKKMIEDPSFDYKNLDNLEAFSTETFGVSAEFNRLKPELDNYFVLIMESIFY